MTVWEIIFTEKNKITGNVAFEKILVTAMLSQLEGKKTDNLIKRNSWAIKSWYYRKILQKGDSLKFYIHSYLWDK